MAQTKKTDNSFERDKIDLRIKHLPSGEVRVLDCYTGYGLIWKGVKHLTGRDIKTLPIDTRDDDIGFHLHGNNQDFLATLDLSRFNVIDLDAYGVPYIQLKTLFERRYTGIVFVTFIQSLYGGLPYGLLTDIGFTEKMIKKSPSLFFKRGWEYFRQWLALNGVENIIHRSFNRKHYLYFNCVAQSGAGWDNQPANTVEGLF